MWNFNSQWALLLFKNVWQCCQNISMEDDKKLVLNLDRFILKDGILPPNYLFPG